MPTDDLWERCRDKALREQAGDSGSESDSPENFPGMSIRSPIVRVILENLGFASLGEWQRYWAEENARLGKITDEEMRSREAYIRSAMLGSQCDLRKERSE